LSQNVSGFFGLEFGGSAPGGPVGNFAQLGVQIDSQATCTYALINPTTTFAAGGGPGSVNISVQPECGWQLSANVPWVTLSAAAGTGSRGVTFTVAANSGAARTGRVTLAGTNGGGASFDIAQAAAVNQCSYSVSANPTNFISNGGGLSVTVTTNAGCDWSAASLDSFITPSGNTSGSGTGTVSFNVAGNASSSARTGRIRVSFTATGATQDVTINQSGGTPVPPPAAVIVNPSSCAVNTSCNFDGSRSTGQITDWSWDFGDGTTGSGPMVSHTYATSFIPQFTSRSITVRLTVTGPGGSNSSTSTITISRTY
jgi:PKD repeat protein